MKYNDRTWQVERDGRSFVVQLQHDVTRDRLDVSVAGSAVPVRRTEQPDGSRLLTFHVAGRPSGIVVRTGGEDFSYELIPATMPLEGPPILAAPLAPPATPQAPFVPAPPSIAPQGWSSAATVWASVAVIVAVLALVGGARVAVKLLARPNWRSFHSEAGHFSIDMPGPPASSTQPVQSARGTIQMTLYTVDLLSRGFVASYWELPEGTVAQDTRHFLEATRDGSASHTHGTVRSSRAIRYEDSPGIEFDVDLPEAKTHQRIFLVGRRVYHLIVLGKDAPPEGETDRFFSSFRPG